MQIFGVPEQGVTYTDRPGAYAFLRNKHDELAILKTTFGTHLPGGGIEPGESELDGLSRELYEEIGVRVKSAELVCQGGQYLFSRHYQKHFRKIGFFYRVELASPILIKMQADHELLWMDSRQAGLELSEELQRWAIAQL